MKQISKIKFYILIWLVLLSILTYIYINITKLSSLEKVLIISGYFFIAFLNLKRTINIRIDYTLKKDILTINKLFSNKTELDLKNLVNWTENHYSLLSFKTSNVIKIQLLNKKMISLYDNEKINYEIVSNYLNDYYSEQFIEKN
jgi:hypothetical protein